MNILKIILILNLIFNLMNIFSASSCAGNTNQADCVTDSSDLTGNCVWDSHASSCDVDVCSNLDRCHCNGNCKWSSNSCTTRSS